MASAVTSIYNNVISAASAGFAPTNSADVSAIASAYQVVSATATQLYAGTAYVTSVNDNPLSASRAGNAANASMANSAYYDGTGRLISALPDSATVSAIASSYAESAASSKQDALTFGYNTADQISSIDGSALGGMDEAAVSAIASAYAESAASSKQDTLTFGYNAENKISSIDGSALAGGQGGGLVTAIGTSESGITSINNSGLVDTAALRSADYSSLYVQEPLYISASGDSSYIGISGTQVNADWTETASSAPSYIENKPDLVDIVAGPGIHIDNPDGNTLRVSQQYPTDETVLWDGSGSTTSSAALSESVSNFQFLDLYMRGFGVSQCPNVVRVAMYDTYTAAQVNWSLGNNDWYVNCQRLSISGSAIGVVSAHAIHGTFNGTSITHESNTDLLTKTICKVVGIHRIAGGN